MERSGSAPSTRPHAAARWRAIALMLGVNTARCDDFKQWSDGKLQMFKLQRTPEQEAILASCNAALTGYFTEVSQKRRKERGADLITSLIDAAEDGEQLDEAEIIGVRNTLLIAGNVTTTDLIGNAVLALLQQPVLARIANSASRLHTMLGRSA